MSASISEIDNYLNPTESRGEVYIEEHKDEVLLYLMEHGVSFPSEISRNINVYIEAVNQVISYFVKLGYVKRTSSDRWYPNVLFKARMTELWSMGLDNFEKINRCSWWVVTPGGIEYLRLKYKGQNKQVRRSLVEYYDMENLADWDIKEGDLMK